MADKPNDVPASGQQAEDQPEPTLADRLSDEDQTYLLWSPDDRDEQLTLLIRQTVCDALFPEGLEGVVEVDDAAAKRMTDLLTGIDQAIADLDIPVNTGNLTLEEVEAAIQKVLDRIADAAELPADFELPEAPDVAEALQNVDTALSVLRTGFRLDTLRTTEITHEGALEALSGQSPFRAKEGPKPAAVFTEIPGEDPDPFWEELLSSVGVGGKSEAASTISPDLLTKDPLNEYREVQVPMVIEYKDFLTIWTRFCSNLEDAWLRDYQKTGLRIARKTIDTKGMMSAGHATRLVKKNDQLLPTDDQFKQFTLPKERTHIKSLFDKIRHAIISDGCLPVSDLRSMLTVRASASRSNPREIPLVYDYTEQAYDHFTEGLPSHANSASLNGVTSTSLLAASDAVIIHLDSRPSRQIVEQEMDTTVNSVGGATLRHFQHLRDMLPLTHGDQMVEQVKTANRAVFGGDGIKERISSACELTDWPLQSTTDLTAVHAKAHNLLGHHVRESDLGLPPQLRTYYISLVPRLFEKSLAGSITMIAGQFPGIVTEDDDFSENPFVQTRLNESSPLESLTSLDQYDPDDTESLFRFLVTGYDWERGKVIEQAEVVETTDFLHQQLGVLSRMHVIPLSQFKKLRGACEQYVLEATSPILDGMVNPGHDSMLLRVLLGTARPDKRIVKKVFEVVGNREYQGDVLSTVEATCESFMDAEVGGKSANNTPSIARLIKTTYRRMEEWIATTFGGDQEGERREPAFTPLVPISDTISLIISAEAGLFGLTSGQVLNADWCSGLVDDVCSACTAFLRTRDQIGASWSRAIDQMRVSMLQMESSGVFDPETYPMKQYADVERTYAVALDVLMRSVERCETGLPDGEEQYLKKLVCDSLRIRVARSAYITSNDTEYLRCPDPEAQANHSLIRSLTEPIELKHIDQSTEAAGKTVLEECRTLPVYRFLTMDTLRSAKEEVLEKINAATAAYIKKSHGTKIANSSPMSDWIERDKAVNANTIKAIVNSPIGLGAVCTLDVFDNTLDSVLRRLHHESELRHGAPKEVVEINKAHDAIRRRALMKEMQRLMGKQGLTGYSSLFQARTSYRDPEEYLSTDESFDPSDWEAAPFWEDRRTELQSTMTDYLRAVVLDESRRQRLQAGLREIYRALEDPAAFVAYIGDSEIGQYTVLEAVYTEGAQQFEAVVNGAETNLSETEDVYLKAVCGQVIPMLFGRMLLRHEVLFGYPNPSPNQFPVEHPLLSALVAPIEIIPLPEEERSETVEASPILDAARKMRPVRVMSKEAFDALESVCLEQVWPTVKANLPADPSRSKFNEVALEESMRRDLVGAFAVTEIERQLVDSLDRVKDRMEDSITRDPQNNDAPREIKEQYQRVWDAVRPWIDGQFDQIAPRTHQAVSGIEISDDDPECVIVYGGKNRRLWLNGYRWQNDLESMQGRCFRYLDDAYVGDDSRCKRLRGGLSKVRHALLVAEDDPLSGLDRDAVATYDALDTYHQELWIACQSVIDGADTGLSDAEDAYVKEILGSQVHIYIASLMLRLMTCHEIGLPDGTEASEHPVLSALVTPVMVKSLKEWEEELNTDPFEGEMEVEEGHIVDFDDLVKAIEKFRPEAVKKGVDDLYEGTTNKWLKSLGEQSFCLTKDVERLNEIVRLNNGNFPEASQRRNIEKQNLLSDILQDLLKIAKPVAYMGGVTKKAEAKNLWVRASSTSGSIPPSYTRQYYDRAVASASLLLGRMKIPIRLRAKAKDGLAKASEELLDILYGTTKNRGSYTELVESIDSVHEETALFLRQLKDRRPGPATKYVCIALKEAFLYLNSKAFLVESAVQPACKPPEGAKLTDCKTVVAYIDFIKNKKEDDAKPRVADKESKEMEATLSREEALLNKPFLGKWWDKSMVACMQRCRFENLKSNRRPSPSEVLREPLEQVDTTVKNRISDLEDDPFIDQRAVDMFVGEVQDDIRETTIPEKTVFHGEEITLPRPQIRIFLSHKATELGEIVKPLLPEVVEENRIPSSAKATDGAREEDSDSGDDQQLGEGEASDEDEAEDAEAQAKEQLAEEIAELRERIAARDSQDKTYGDFVAEITQQWEVAAATEVRLLERDEISAETVARLKECLERREKSESLIALIRLTWESLDTDQDSGS